MGMYKIRSDLLERIRHDASLSAVAIQPGRPCMSRRDRQDRQTVTSEHLRLVGRSRRHRDDGDVMTPTSQAARQVRDRSAPQSGVSPRVLCIILVE